MRLMYCPNCFRMNYNGKYCSDCNYTNQTENTRPCLLPGIQLNSRYDLGRVLGEGGFGITYLALDEWTKQKCAIKEYFPAEFSIRGRDDVSVAAVSMSKEDAYLHGMEKFMEEAQNLRAMADIDSIVNVGDYFRENGTAYFVMNYLDGCTLKQKFVKAGNHLPYEEATRILLFAAQSLERVHKRGMIHRDISPENIFLTKNGSVILIDFGAARGYLENKKSAQGGFSVLLKHGFAPLEQYFTDGNQGTWTDVYALAATYYYVVSGRRVPQAVDRVKKNSRMPELSALCPQVPLKVSQVIRKALALDYRKRIKNMAVFYESMRRAAGWNKAVLTQHSREVRQGWITRISNAGTGQKWELPPDLPQLMGRTYGERREVNIVIDREDRTVSREHCYVTYLPKYHAFQVCDRSEFGTYGPKGRLEKHRNCLFPSGTVIYTASSKYQFLLEEK